MCGKWYVNFGANIFTHETWLKSKDAVIISMVQFVLSGAHYLDVSGEPEFMERVQAKYHDQAKEKHLVIVSSCAFDSALADLGASKAVEVFHEKYPDADLEK